MRNSKNGLDEMQTQRRNSIGNQMFMLMFYALLFDCGLHGAGIRWLSYPANIMVIIMVCMSIYLVRLIAFNAYLPAKAQNRKTGISLVIAIAFSMGFTKVAINLFNPSTAPAQDNSALILVIVSAVGLLSAFITTVIRKINNRGDEDE